MTAVMELYTSFFAAQISILTIAVPVALSVLSTTTERYSIRLASQLLRDKALWAVATMIAASAVPSALGIATTALTVETPSLTPVAVLVALPLALLLYVLMIARAVRVLQPSRVIESAVRQTSHAALRQQADARYRGDRGEDNVDDEALVGASEIAHRAVDDADVRALKAFTHALVARLLRFAAEATRQSPDRADQELNAVVKLVLLDYFEPLFRRAATKANPWPASVVVKAVETVGTAELRPRSDATALAAKCLHGFHALVDEEPWADGVRARIQTALAVTRAYALARSVQRPGESTAAVEASRATTDRSDPEIGSPS
jgi:hypothetical protein